MFISCQECNTTFRLDEKLLKPTGSKVRCSQCRHVFVAYPPAPEPLVDEMPAAESEAPAEAMSASEAHELEGIDLAELDAILEHGAQEAATRDDETDLPATDDELALDGDLEGLEDADFEIDFETALDPEAESIEPQAITSPDIAGEETMEDLDLDFEFEIHDEDTLAIENDEAVAPVETQAEQPDSADVPQMHEGVTPVRGEETHGDDLEFEELALEFDEVSASPDVAKPAQPSASLEPDSNDLQLIDLDFDLAEEAASPASDIEADEPELALDDAADLEGELGMALESEEPRSQAFGSPKEEAGSELDLDLDLDLDFDAGAQPQMEDSESEQPSLSAESPSVKEPEEEALTLEDDLDLTDLDALMETTGVEAEEGDVDEDEPELVLEMEEKPVEASRSKADMEEDLEDLDFSLDREIEDDTSGIEDKAKDVFADSGDTLAEEEIDLSDIEQMLEGNTLTTATGPKPEVRIEKDLGFGGGDEIDLSEIESAIDEADLLPKSKTDDDAIDDQELDLDLDLDVDLSPAAHQPSETMANESATGAEAAEIELGELDLELEMEDAVPPVAGESRVGDIEELDLSDLGELIEEKDQDGELEVIHSGDIELEFHIEEEDDRLVGETAGAGKVDEEAEARLSETSRPLIVEDQPIQAPKPMPFKTRRKKRRPLLLALLIFLLLIGGAGGLYYAVVERGISVPFVGDIFKQIDEYFRPAPQDAFGIRSLSTLDISSKFIENDQSGRLFVITGKVRNGYATPRDMIRVQGNLYTQGKTLLKSETSYAGLTIADQDLASQPFVEISQLLKALPQDETAITAVGPGQNLPFMLVFSDLPPADQLDEFAVELVSSRPGR